jgi:outer membrane receptor protein involved in Fe transport
LRAFATGSRFGDAPWLKGTRLTLSVVNLTNDRQRVRDSAGITPLSYQRDYRDPLGRTVELEIRKVF